MLTILLPSFSVEARALNGSAADYNVAILGSNLPPLQPTSTLCAQVGYHLEWRSAMSWPQMGAWQK